MLRAVGEGFDDALQCAVESLGEVKGLVQEAIGQLAVVRSDLINADLSGVSVCLCGRLIYDVL